MSHGHVLRSKKTRAYKAWRNAGRTGQRCSEWKSFENFLKDMGEATWGEVLRRKDTTKKFCRDNCCWSSGRGNYKHGHCQTTIYCRWQNIKRSAGGVCLSWRDINKFIEDVGPQPDTNFQLFRIKSYQRSRKGNVQWKCIKIARPIWKYISSAELIACIEHIEILCRIGHYDLDIALDMLYSRKISNLSDPANRLHSWIKRYLPRDLARIKKRRGEVEFKERT